MRAFFGTTLFLLGQTMTLVTGLPRVFLRSISSGQDSEAHTALFLVLAGVVVATLGSSFARGLPPHKARLGSWLFAACFVSCASLMALGLANVYVLGRTGVSLFLIVIGFVGSIASASNALN